MKLLRSATGFLPHLCISSLLVACGGGDGSPAAVSSDRIAPVLGTAANLADVALAEAVVADAARSVSDAQNMTSSGGLFSTVATGTANTTGTVARLSVGDLGQALAKVITQGPGPMTSPLTYPLTSPIVGVQTQTNACPGGGSLQTMSEQASTGSLNLGDSYIVKATQCIMTVSNQTWRIQGEMRMQVLAGTNISPDNLAGVTLGFEMTPLLLQMQDSGDEVGLDGGFRIQYDTEHTYRWSSWSSSPNLTLRLFMDGQTSAQTLNDFIYDVHSGSLSGHATVNTTRHFASPAQYSWTVLEDLSFVPLDDIVAGTLLITSNAGGTQIRLRFGQSCSASSTPTCVIYERSSDGSTFDLVRTYTWSEFRQL